MRAFSFFTCSLAACAAVSFALMPAACSSSDSNNNTTPTGDGGGIDGGNGDGGGINNEEAGLLPDGGLIPIDPGEALYQSVLLTPVKTYTCTGELHVATNGNDANNGSAASPYLTISKAALLAKAGDCVKVHAGTYAENLTIAFAVDGTADKPIVLVSVDGRGAAIIDGAGNHGGPAVEVKQDYVIIDGFEFKNTPTDTTNHVVRFDGTYAGKCVGSVLRNCKITGGYAHLKIYQKTQGILVEHNEFYGKAANVPLSLTGASGLVFRANYCHEWDSGDNGSVQIAGGSTDVLVEKNVFQGISTSAGAVALGDSCGSTCDNDPEHYGAVNARAINNIFYRTRRAIDILGCKNCSVLSNTIVESGRGNLVFRLAASKTNGVSKTSVGTRIFNNILSDPAGLMSYVMRIDSTAGDGLQMNYNLFWNGANGVTFGESHPASADANSIKQDPLLISATDLKIGPTSPGIGAGTNLAAEVADDFLSVARPSVGAFDVGALQH